MFRLKILLVNLLTLNFLLAFIVADRTSCIYQKTCDKCLATDFECGWCIDKKFSTNKPRCMSSADLLKEFCSPEDIITNSASSEITEDKELQNFQENAAQITQIRPQKLKMTLVPSHTQQIKLTYRPAKNYPLDLYFLMDLTWTMRDDKQTLVDLGENLARALGNLTTNYRFGFGSYADKPTLPMIMPGRYENPCSMERETCEPTYGFRHHLALTKDTKEFVRRVNQSHVTGNLDNLEGGFDALMQVVVCDTEIGWSENARKLVILATDGLMHLAGDGLLAGATKRNDKQCHLSELNEFFEYTGSLEYDYPSLEEIYRELLRRKISVIFAVTSDVKDTYYDMSNLMQEVSGVEILTMDSSNIIDLVEKGYQRFASRFQLSDNSPSHISVTYETNCGGSLDGLKKRNFCDQITRDQTIEFHINITLNETPQDHIYNHTIRIADAGLSDSLEIDIEIQKPCPCTELDEADDESFLGTVYCNNHGKFRCGMCYCEDGWLGDSCSCNSGNSDSIKALEIKCRKPLNDTLGIHGEICSEHGECECGECFCNRNYEGPFCECKKCQDCDLKNAVCDCGECICKEGWSGYQCQCSTSQEACIAPNTGKVCSQHGECYCGQCTCDDTFFGKFCEENINSGNQLCSYYEPCVLCKIHEQEDSNNNVNCSEVCQGNDRTYFESVFVNVFSEGRSQCKIRVKNSEDIICEHGFSYESVVNTGSVLEIQKNKCSPVNYAMAGIIFFISTLLLGLMIIISIKSIFYVKDKREYAAFMEQQQKTKFEMQSPIYKSPVTFYNVPKMNDD